MADEPKKKPSSMGQLVMFSVVSNALMMALVETPGPPKVTDYTADIIRYQGHVTTLLELAAVGDAPQELRDMAALFALMAFVKLLKRHEDRVWDTLSPELRAMVERIADEALSAKREEEGAVH